ncbi:MAG: hypothetical protein C7B43_18590 [Sulfobacillus benefaciens]|uniref:Uncharacterized protein n=1 Tax=Sulfobacillus benefaciens TaxID=453960 RepID=A0A2T2WQW2_9FIRM|nr:MAG: hypothetical protein C7B43_18590 [Sulfobacillus benefaciens]
MNGPRVRRGLPVLGWLRSLSCPFSQWVALGWLVLDKFDIRAWNPRFYAVFKDLNEEIFSAVSNYGIELPWSLMGTIPSIAGASFSHTCLETSQILPIAQLRDFPRGYFQLS